MPEFDPEKRRAATAMFKLGVKASTAGVHRTVNRPPKGTGWVQCVNAPAGMMCRPDKVRESIDYFQKAYDIDPDIVALNQIALAHEMLGEMDRARSFYGRMKEQAARESDAAYLNAAEMGLARIDGRFKS